MLQFKKITNLPDILASFIFEYLPQDDRIRFLEHQNVPSFEPKVLTHLKLEHLTLKEMIKFMELPYERLLEQEIAGLTPENAGKREAIEQDKKNFRKTIKATLENYLVRLRESHVHIISISGEAHKILSHTFAKLQREKEILLANESVTEVHKGALHAIHDQLIKLNAQLNIINMELAQRRLADYDLETSSISLGDLGLTRLPEALITKLQEYKRLSCLYLNDNYLALLPDSLSNLTLLYLLQLDRNYHLITLPESFGNLRALRVLGLDRTHSLTTLPESVRPILVRTQNQKYLHLIPAPAMSKAASAIQSCSSSSSSSAPSPSVEALSTLLAALSLTPTATPEPPTPAARLPIMRAFEAKREAKLTIGENSASDKNKANKAKRKTCRQICSIQ